MLKKKFPLLLIFAAIIIGIVYYMPSIEKIVKNLTHKYGSEVTKTEVNLGGFNLSLRKGEASLSNITVANPSSYKTPYAFELGDISVKLDVATIANDVIIVKNVEIIKPVVTYEMASLTSSNLTDIQKNITDFTTKPADKIEETKSEDVKSDESASAKKVIIENLYVSGGKIQFLAPFMGKEPIALKLPTIHLKDIGKEKKGASIGEVVSKVIGSINDTAVQIVSKEQLSKITGNIGEEIDKAGEELNKAKDSLLNSTKNLKNLF